LSFSNQSGRIGYGIAALDSNRSGVDSEVSAKAANVVALCLPAFAHHQDCGQAFARCLSPFEAALLFAHLPMLGLVVTHSISAGQLSI
jgi:hypothetical protein